MDYEGGALPHYPKDTTSDNYLINIKPKYHRLKDFLRRKASPHPCQHSLHNLVLYRTELKNAECLLHMSLQINKFLCVLYIRFICLTLNK